MKTVAAMKNTIEIATQKCYKQQHKKYKCIIRLYQFQVIKYLNDKKRQFKIIVEICQKKKKDHSWKKITNITKFQLDSSRNCYQKISKFKYSLKIWCTSQSESIGKHPSPTSARDKANIEYISGGQLSPFELAFGVELGSNLHSRWEYCTEFGMTRYPQK